MYGRMVVRMEWNGMQWNRTESNVVGFKVMFSHVCIRNLSIPAQTVKFGPKVRLSISLLLQQLSRLVS